MASGDRLRVIVFGQDSLTNSFNVDGAGNVAMPLIGSVHVLGLTTTQAAGAIAARLRAGYLREPKVSVEVAAFRPFFVLGEVTTSGQYPFVNGMTAQTAVAIAGGFSPRGDQSGVDLTRDDRRPADDGERAADLPDPSRRHGDRARTLLLGTRPKPRSSALVGARLESVRVEFERACGSFMCSARRSAACFAM